MKIAVCFIGQMRTALNTNLSIKKYIGTLKESCDFFIHTWNINTPAPGIETDILEMHIVYKELKEYIDPIIIEEYSQIYSPLSMIVEDFSSYLKIGSVSMPFYYSVKRVLELKNKHEINSNVKYDYIVVCRPDLFIGDNKSLENDLELITEDSDFAFLDISNDGHQQIDSSLWIFKGDLANSIMMFDDYRVDTSNKENDQILLKRWLEIDLNVKTTPFPNKNAYILRKSCINNSL